VNVEWLTCSSACLAQILSEVHKAITQGITVTKRDIYYRDPSLFRNQETVDRYVDDIAHTCGVTRRDLNIVSLTGTSADMAVSLTLGQIASPKGLVAGRMSLPANDERPIIQTICDQTPLPESAGINWLLIIEKEVCTKSFASLVGSDQKPGDIQCIGGKRVLQTPSHRPGTSCDGQHCAGLQRHSN
jgi:hypothetical protein